MYNDKKSLFLKFADNAMVLSTECVNESLAMESLKNACNFLLWAYEEKI
jgi:hypothetical protein